MPFVLQRPECPSQADRTTKPGRFSTTLAVRLEICESFEQAMALKQLQLLVRGRVQGVYFRASTQREARRLGITGWVKNRADGTIEIVAEGEEVSIRELYGWAQKGPTAARVERVDTRWRSFTGDFPDFRIID
jgi:acylphosphatase